MASSSASPRFDTFASLLRHRAETQGDQVVFTFLDHEIEKVETLTFQQLLRGASQAANCLRDCQGKPALLLFPPGPKLISALFGCFLSGAIAVPARTPHPNRLHRADPRLAAVARDASVNVVLTTPEIAAVERRGHSPERPLFGLTLRVIDENAPFEGFKSPRLSADAPAMIQYTSGSTATPRGVVLSHRSLLANQEQIHSWLSTTRADRFLSWLSPYHDMGLIGAILHPVFLGARAWLMDPVDFIRHPASWLLAISRYHITVSGAPDFAYALAAERTSKTDRAKLDLQRWRVAFCGAEPVRHHTLEQFADTFAKLGFKREALTPCYGLAEATLFVSGAKPEEEPRYMALDPEALTRHHVRPPADESQAVLVTSCGVPEGTVRIVSLATGKPCQPDRIGEIWIKTPSSDNHYHHRPGQSNATFGAMIDQEGPFLRTGDLGFLKDDHLFVTGREKELIIIRGRNHYPQDLEWTAETALGHLPVGKGSAFSLADEKGERMVLVWELVAREGVAPELAADAIRAAICAEHGILVDEIVFIEKGSLPRTSSGKIKRRMCRALYLGEQLKLVSRHPLRSETRSKGATDLSRTLAAVPTDVHRLHLLSDYLLQTVGKALQLDAPLISIEKPLSAMGLDSLSALEISHHIEQDLGCLLAPSQLLQGLTIAQVANQVMATWQAETPLASPTPSPAPYGRHPLSYNQRQTWGRISTRGRHNISFAAALPADIRTELLIQALTLLVDRHDMLRTTIGVHEGEPFQWIHPQMVLKLDELDAHQWRPEELVEHIADEAHHPLGEGPFWRVILFHRKNEGPVMLWVADPVALDLWSLALMVHEFGAAYRDLLREQDPELPPPALTYADYVHWHEQLLAGPEGRRTWAYWQRTLLPRPPRLELPTDRKRERMTTDRAAVCDFTIPMGLVWELESLARQQGTTLCAVLMAAWFFLLHRYSNQDDLLVGTLSTGRDRASLGHMVGPLANLLPIRANLSATPRFSDFVKRLYATMLAAQDNQSFPYALLCERLADVWNEPNQDFCQVLFLYQSRPPMGDVGLSRFALGEGNAQLNLFGLELRGIDFEQRSTAHELTLTVVESRTGGDFSAVLEYRADLFEPATIARMAIHFNNLLTALVQDPNLHTDEWHLLSLEERQRLMMAESSKRIRKRRTSLHQLFQKQASRASDNLVVIQGDRSWSYAQLNANANRLAHALIARGVGQEVPVGLCCERSLEMVAAVLAVLKAGAVLVPILPHGGVAPPDELAREARCALVLCPRYLAYLFPKEELPPLFPLDFSAAAILEASPENPDVVVTPASLAYLRHQSSDGVRRWISISHANLIQLPAALAAHLEMSTDDSGRKPVWCAAANLNDAGGIAELLLPLALGSKLVVADPNPLTTDVDQKQLNHRGRGITFSIAWEDIPQGDDEVVAASFLPAVCSFADKGPYQAIWLVGDQAGMTRANALVWATQAAMNSKRVRLRYAGSPSLITPAEMRDWTLIRTLSRGRLEPFLDQGAKVTGFVQVTPDEVSFREAGTLGARVLVRANGRPYEELGRWTEAYRAARAAAGHEGAGHVTFMLPVWLSRDGVIPELLQPTYRRWLQARGFDKNTAKTMAREAIAQPNPTIALFGTAGAVAPLVDRLKGMGVDEIACEVAFGLPEPVVLAHLPQLGLLASRCAEPRHGQTDLDFKRFLSRLRVSHLHCAEAGVKLLFSEGNTSPPDGLHHILLSGAEPHGKTLAQLRQLCSVTVSYLHGQGETTTSALIRRVCTAQGSESLGYPLAHTQAYVVDRQLQPCQRHKSGELAVGGDGLCRGYGHDPKTTAVRFVPDPFGDEVGGRLFLTGIRVRHGQEGTLITVQRH